MLNFFLFLFCFLSACSSIGSKKKFKISFEKFNKITNSAGFIPLNDGRNFLLLTRFPEDAYRKVYKVNYKTKRRSLVYDAGQSVGWLASDKPKERFYIGVDEAGDENYKLYELNLKTKKIIQILGRKGRRTLLLSTDAPGERLLLLSNHINKALYQPFVYNHKNKRLEGPLVEKDFGVSGAKIDWSNNRLFVTRSKNNATTQLYSVDFETKKATLVHGRLGDQYRPSYFLKDRLYIQTSHKKDRVGCAYIDLKKPKKIHWVRYSETKDQFCFYDKSQDFSRLRSSGSGRSTVRLFKGHFEKEVELVQNAEKELVKNTMVIPNTGFNTFLVEKHFLGKPPEIYYLQGKKEKRVTDFNKSGLSFKDMAQTEDFYYSTYDEKKIHSILVTQKHWAKSQKKRPVIIWPHGGPDWYSGHEYYPYFQYYALSGYIVLAPNFRGSTSFGKKFETLNDKDWGGGHIKDLVWAKKALKSLPYADLENVFIAGRSFGGYSTLAAITYHPNEFKAAVAILAIGDLFEFLKTIPPNEGWQNEFKSEVGVVGKDDKLIRARSPFFHAEKVVVPLKVYHTENDTRTRIENMDKYVSKLKALNKPVDYEVIKGEGHSPKKKETWERLLKGTVEFFNKQL